MENIPVQPAMPNTTVPSPSKKWPILVLVLILLLIGILVASQYQNKKTAPVPKAPVASTKPQASLSPPKLDVSMGTITTLSASSMTVKSASSSATFDISKLSQVQRLISGVFGSGKVASASAKDLKIGQEIHVIGSGGFASSVTIIK